MLFIDGELEFDCEFDFIISKIKEVTNNYALLKYTANSIRKNNGVLGIKHISDDKCDFGFKNEEESYLYINIDNDKIYIYNNNLNYREEVIYDKSYDGISIEFFGNYRKYGERGIVELEKVEEKSYYDSNKKFIKSETHIEKNTCLNGLIMKRLMGTNYDRYIKQCVVKDEFKNDEIVKIDEMNYHYIPEVNSRKCYVGEYRNGMFCSVNEDTYELPSYAEVKGDFSDYEYKIRSVEKKHAQKQKTML